jgi:hypothetical protein
LGFHEIKIKRQNLPLFISLETNDHEFRFQDTALKFHGQDIFGKFSSAENLVVPQLVVDY